MARTKFQLKAQAAVVNVGSEKPPINRKKRERKVIESQEIDNQHFIAIDGEGENDVSKDYYYDNPSGNCFRISDHKCVNRSAYQKYTLLCASTGESISNPQGLSTGECLHWLCDLGIKYPRGIFIIFGGSYDLTMWLRDLKFEQLKEVRAYADVPDKRKAKIPCSSVYQVGENSYVYGVDYLPRKFCGITRFEVLLSKDKKHYIFKRGSNGKKVRHGHITIWDVWGFFQCKFVKAIEEYGLLKDQTDITFLANMKDARDQFDKFDQETVKKYCFMECHLLVKLMDKVKLYVGELGLKLRRWDGSGALSSALLTKHNIKWARGEGLPERIEEICRHAFSGGRIELIQYGHYAGTIYDADVNSAYPYETSNLPIMRGTWQYSEEIESEWSLVLVKWELTSTRARFFPFFYRDDDKCISYPQKGMNWVHLCELQAYLKNQHIYAGTVEIHGVWNFFPDSDYKPFEFIPDLAAQRLVWKKLYKSSGGTEGGQHMMAKTGLNGIYGKTAQTVGMFTDEDGEVHNPPFHNLYWAGRVTAGTRAKIFDAACIHPESVIMFATDGLFTTRPRNLPYSNKLGEWELSYTKGATFVQSGVYYFGGEKFTFIGSKQGLEKVQTKENVKDQSDKTRGFEKGTITERDILSMWEQKIWKTTGESKVFITYGIIATSCQPDTIEQNMKRLGNWETKIRELHLTPNGTKREYDPRCNPLQKRGPNPAKRLIPTIPKWNEQVGLSTPYEIDMAYVADQEELAEQWQFEV